MDNLILRLEGLYKLNNILPDDDIKDLLFEILNTQQSFYYWTKDATAKYYAEVISQSDIERIEYIISDKPYKIKSKYSFNKNVMVVIYEK